MNGVLIDHMEPVLDIGFDLKKRNHEVRLEEMSPR